MTNFHIYHLITLVTLAFISWKLPLKWQIPGISLLSNIFICWVSPISAIHLFISATVVYLISKYAVRSNLWTLIGVGFCILQFLSVRYLQTYGDTEQLKSLSVLGIAYYTCRHIHYLIEVYKGNIIVSLRQFWYYQSFFPVMMIGPINSYHEFVREIQRRRWDSNKISIAIERIVYGYAIVLIIGNYLIAQKLGENILLFETNIVFYAWLKSVHYWLYLYAQFSGWSSIAIGFSQVMGIRISENFNYPFFATNLVDFWQRWHISLSNWCKNYVFTPIIAITRKPLVAIVAAMIAIGVWHELSTYYLIWGLYHAIGIAGCRIFQQYSSSLKFLTKSRGWPVVAWILTMNYIICGRPIISIIDHWIHRYV
jgi:alginate O-acetyltransferase complex protein AlgI